MFSDSAEKTYLPSSYIPTEADVICARGKDAFFHEGNKQFRELIDANIPQYIEADTKLEKSAIVMQIVGQIRSNSDTGFVRFCNQKKLWYEIGEEAAREKVGQTIRETLTQRDPNKRAKKRMKRAINKAKRDAAREALLDGFDLEPLPVDQMLSLQYFSQRLIAQPRPSLVIPSAAQLLGVHLLPNVAAFQPRIHADELVVMPPQLNAVTSMDLEALTAATSSAPKLNLLNSDTKQVPGSARVQEEVIPPPPALRFMTSKDFDALAATPPSLTAMTSREWATDEDAGCTVTQVDYETMENLFEEHERSRLSAAAC